MLSSNSRTKNLLAKRILDFETAAAKPYVSPSFNAVLVCEKLRVPLSKLAGPEGFFFLFSRALLLAKAKVPWLANVCVQENGTLDGFLVAAQDQKNEETELGSVVLVNELLDLLSLFIGEPLMLVLLKDEWPEINYLRNESTS